MNDLRQDHGDLSTPRFLQYQGPIPAATGLAQPRLAIGVELADDRGSGRSPRPFRRRTDLGHHRAGASGPVFVLTGPSWNDLIESSRRGGGLPEDVFAPKRQGPAGGCPVSHPRPRDDRRGHDGRPGPRRISRRALRMLRRV